MPSDRWIQDFRYLGATRMLFCTEVHGKRMQSYNTLTGMPIYRTQLRVNWSDAELAISQLLGTPERWPYPTGFSSVVCTAAQINNDKGEYVGNVNGQLLTYSDAAFIDVEYQPRLGVYVEDYYNEVVYWEDSIAPRNEFLPMSSKGLIWGKSGDETTPTKIIELHPDEVPTKFLGGMTLVHLIEGAYYQQTYIMDLIGKVTSHDYYSYNLDRHFSAGTLMLRDWNEQQAFTFRSYRLPKEPSLGNADDTTLSSSTTDGRPYDPSGRATSIMRLYYEYNPNGWDKFWRNDVDGATSGYYYIKQNASPYNTVKPFPVADHRTFLGKTRVLF